MKYLSQFESFNNKKIYTNVIVDDNDLEYFYQIPFELFESDQVLGGDYVLGFSDQFFYDGIVSDDMITTCLENDLSDVNLEKGWQNYTKDIFASENPNYHAMRVAKLVKEMQSNNPINPVTVYFDERAYEFAPNYIDDGSHRIRALKYLKYDYFPALIGGSHATYLIQWLKEHK